MNADEVAAITVHSLAPFGRTSDADAKPYEGDDAARVHAQRTWERARTVAQHVPAGDPAVKEALNDLVAAVSSIIDT